MARRLISLLALAFIAVSCGVSGGYGTAQRFQDGIYYKGFDEDMLVADPLTEEDFQRLAAENIRKEQFGDQRLQALLQQDLGSARQTSETIHKAVEEFVGNAEPSDDLTKMCIKMKSA